MPHTCPSKAFTRVVTSVGYCSGDGYLLTVSHYHSGDLAPCAVDQYTHLAWTELVDVVLAVLEEYRPGAHPGGWEQLSLTELPSWWLKN